MSDVLVRITALANLLVQAIGDVAVATAKLSDAKETQRRLEEDDLPELMRELGLTEIKLADGSAVKVVDEVSCGISVERRPSAHAWLTEHGFGGLIKTEIVMVFARDEHDAAVECAERITETFERVATLMESVHPQTLKAFVKEQLERGAGVPQDLFGVRPYAKAKITAPRAK